MKKLVMLAAVLLLICGQLTGCGSAPTESSSRIITDCAGVEVEIPEKIERVVCISASAVPFLVGMGVEDKIVGAHDEKGTCGR